MDHGLLTSAELYELAARLWHATEACRDDGDIRTGNEICDLWSEVADGEEPTWLVAPRGSASGKRGSERRLVGTHPRPVVTHGSGTPLHDALMEELKIMRGGYAGRHER